VRELKSIDLNMLPALEALLDERHVTRAGERVRLTQSAMSGVLRRLRTYFDDELLVRSGNDLVLTPLAESLIPLVRDARRATDRLFSAATTFDPAASTRLFTVSASDYVQATLAPPLARTLAQIESGVRVDFVPHPVDLLREPQSVLLKYDLVVLPPNYLPAYERTSEVLFEDDFVCIIAAKHAAVSDRLPTMAELADIPLVTASFGLNQQHLVPLGGLVIARSDVELTRPTMEVSSYLSIPSIVREGQHWALIPRRLADLECPTDLFAVFEPPFPADSFTDSMFWHVSRTHDPALTWLREMIRSVLSAENFE
jgi:DNA-binding transcriptional LysR family regulator